MIHLYITSEDHHYVYNGYFCMYRLSSSNLLANGVFIKEGHYVYNGYLCTYTFSSSNLLTNGVLNSLQFSILSVCI